jgi:hypothetical protein
MKISTQPSPDWKVSILKISTKKKKAGLYTKDNLDLDFDLDWSRLLRPPGLLDPFQVNHSKTNALVFSLLK